MPYKDKEKYNEYMRNRRKPNDVNPDNVNPELTELGKTVESMSPNELELWVRFGFDCRTPVYCRLLAEQVR